MKKLILDNLNRMFSKDIFKSFRANWTYFSLNFQIAYYKIQYKIRF